MWPWPTRRKRLIERRTRLVKLVARYQAVIAEIEAELRSHGINPRDYRPSRPYPLPGISRGEMGHLCLGILRETQRPMRMREIVAAVMARKGLDQADAGLVKLVSGRAGSVLEATKRRGVTRIIGPKTSRYVRHELRPVNQESL